MFNLTTALPYVDLKKLLTCRDAIKVQYDAVTGAAAANDNDYHWRETDSLSSVCLISLMLKPL